VESNAPLLKPVKMDWFIFYKIGVLKVLAIDVVE
jgi:hypothetical protein